jgi:hypothetical protein
VLIQHTGMYPVPERALCSTAEAVVFSLGAAMWSLFTQPLPVTKVKWKVYMRGSRYTKSRVAVAYLVTPEGPDGTR